MPDTHHSISSIGPTYISSISCFWAIWQVYRRWIPPPSIFRLIQQMYKILNFSYWKNQLLHDFIGYAPTLPIWPFVPFPELNLHRSKWRLPHSFRPKVLKLFHIYSSHLVSKLVLALVADTDIHMNSHARYVVVSNVLLSLCIYVNRKDCYGQKISNKWDI